MPRLSLLTVSSFVLHAAGAGAQAPPDRHVGAGQAFSTIASAVATAPATTRVIVHDGVYREGTLHVSRPLTLTGIGNPVLDGQGRGTVILVDADDVAIEGLTIINTGISQLEERAGIKVRNARGCRIERNRLDRTLFGVYLEKTADCAVRHNVITGAGVASGIDFALAVAAILEGEEVARQIQLQIEYDPSPPFDSGSTETASAETVALLRSRGAALNEQRRVVAERVGKTLGV